MPDTPPPPSTAPETAGPSFRPRRPDHGIPGPERSRRRQIKSERRGDSEPAGIESAAPHEEESPPPREPDAPARAEGGRFAQSLPIVVGVVGLLAYFVWLCLEMSQQTLGGAALPAAIFGAAVAGIIAAGLAFIPTGRRRTSN